MTLPPKMTTTLPRTSRTRAPGVAATACALAFILAACGPAPDGSGYGPDTGIGADPCLPGGEPTMRHVPSPDWGEQVIYMMFTDRFDDGDPDNNDFGQGEYDPSSPSHFNGGDLQGIIDRLDYIQGLGATAIWITPPVRNQWWSTPYRAAGWHGYWAQHFMEMDPHAGTLEDYRRLSHELHCRGMYLVQDIVINHVGNYYAYDGEWNPDDPTENFYLIEEGITEPTAPTQEPFNLIDPRIPEHREADIYHWTPQVTDYDDPYQLNYFGFGYLADINTENPVVLDAFKESYGYWIREVGVDGFRIDTVQYVDQPFWHHFLHDEDGIYATAAATGRDHFITFGETMMASDPFANQGEDRNAYFMDYEGLPGLNSMLGFPLYFSQRRVLSEGQPAAQLAYRLEQHMSAYPDPRVIPTFIDNHDTARFIATAGEAAFRQALALVYTIPGLPIVYMGTEQKMTETRHAMFAGGWEAEVDRFDTESDGYRLLRDLAALRASDALFTDGDLEVLAGETAGPGLLAYRRDHEDRAVLVLLNSADHGILVHELATGLAPETRLEALWADGPVPGLATGRDGLLSLELPARAAWVLRPAGPAKAPGDPSKDGEAPVTITFDAAPEGEVLLEDTPVTGRSAPDRELQVIPDGNLDRARTVRTDAEGRFELVLPVRDLGEAERNLQLRDPASGAVSPRLSYRTQVSEPEFELRFDDPMGDALGPRNDYVIPQHSESRQQRDIESLRVRGAGRNLEIELTMKEVSTPWSPINGFDNVAITTFIGFPDRSDSGARALPLLGADMPDGRHWNLAHAMSGWLSYVYRDEGATGDHQGARQGFAPRVVGDAANRTITVFLEGGRLGIEDWTGVTLYVTTWDMNGEGGYIDLLAEPSNWAFGGGQAGDPKIADDLLVTLP